MKDVMTEIKTMVKDALQTVQVQCLVTHVLEEDLHLQTFVLKFVETES